jgi:uncharacterized protein YpmB
MKKNAFITLIFFLWSTSCLALTGELQESLKEQGCLSGILGHWVCTSNLSIIKECQIEYPNSDYGQRLCEYTKQQGLNASKKRLFEMLEMNGASDGEKHATRLVDQKMEKTISSVQNGSNEQRSNYGDVAFIFISIAAAFLYLCWKLKKSGDSDKKAATAQSKSDLREIQMMEQMKKYHSEARLNRDSSEDKT